MGAGQVNGPCQLFVDSDDNILVADYNNKFHQNGNHNKFIGTGRLLNPLGVCMDPEGRIIVSESESCKYQEVLKSAQFEWFLCDCHSPSVWQEKMNEENNKGKRIVSLV